MTEKWNVNELCATLKVSESGYYRYVRSLGKPSKDKLLSDKMEEIRNASEHNDNYGVERMQLALAQQGIKAGKRRIGRIMREKGWIHVRRRPKGLTKVDPEAMVSENLLHQDFSAAEPFTKVLTDITQIPCLNAKLYISPILDCSNGEILSLCMATNMKKELVIDTLHAAINRYPRLKGAILHSDRGSQYTSEAFREALASNGMIQSLSGVDHCYDNARMESFFATLKKELLYRIPTYRMTVEQVKTAVFRYVFGYYNTTRVYTSNPGGWPPTVYRELAMRAAA
jgi:transposase InsO family protein